MIKISTQVFWIAQMLCYEILWHVSKHLWKSCPVRRMHSESYLMADNMKSLQEILAKRTDFYGEYPQVSWEMPFWRQCLRLFSCNTWVCVRPTVELRRKGGKCILFVNCKKLNPLGFILFLTFQSFKPSACLFWTNTTFFMWLSWWSIRSFASLGCEEITKAKAQRTLPPRCL